MKVKCMVSGGFVGIEKTVELETQNFSNEELQSFEETTKQSLKDENMRDDFVYHFKFEKEGQEVEVALNESLLTAQMLPFIEKLNKELEQ